MTSSLEPILAAADKFVRDGAAWTCPDVVAGMLAEEP